jgi:homoserine dehydrogenase
VSSSQTAPPGALAPTHAHARTSPAGGTQLTNACFFCHGSDTTELHISALSLGAAVATANKVPVTCALPRYAALTAQPRRFRAESTVGAGLPVHAALSRFVAAGDPISRIAGAFSGTLGYVMSGLEAGRAFSEVVTAAKAEGCAHTHAPIRVQVAARSFQHTR